eukprot:Gb_02772 [translate_table: standard]
MANKGDYICEECGSGDHDYANCPTRAQTTNLVSLVPDQVQMLNLQTRSKHYVTKTKDDYPNPATEKSRVQEATQLLKETINEIKQANKQPNESIPTRELKVYQRRLRISEPTLALQAQAEEYSQDTKLRLMMQWSDELDIKIPLKILLATWLKRESDYPKIIKENSIKLITHIDEDPKVPMHILHWIIPKTIVDGSSNVKVLPITTWEQIGKPPVTLANYSIKLTDQSMIRPIGACNRRRCNGHAGIRSS